MRVYVVHVNATGLRLTQREEYFPFYATDGRTVAVWLDYALYWPDTAGVPSVERVYVPALSREWSGPTARVDALRAIDAWVSRLTGRAVGSSDTTALTVAYQHDPRAYRLDGFEVLR